MSQQQVRVQTPMRKAAQQVASFVGKRICEERMRFPPAWRAPAPASVGVWKWLDEAMKEIARLKEARQWDYEVPDTDTVHRLINYLADKDETDDGVARGADDPPQWERMGLKYLDTDPRGIKGVKVQSTYRLVNSGNSTATTAAEGRPLPASALTGGARVAGGQSAHARASPATHAVSSKVAITTYVINDANPAPEALSPAREREP